MVPITPVIAVAAMASSPTATGHHPAWMVGHWAWVGPTERLNRGDCPESEIYRRNGVVTDGDAVSRWSIDGTYLVRTTLRPGNGEPASTVGQTVRQRFMRRNRDTLVFRNDGVVQWLVRCKDVPPPR